MIWIAVMVRETPILQFDLGHTVADSPYPKQRIMVRRIQSRRDLNYTQYRRRKAL
jgi:hypothetical protein